MKYLPTLENICLITFTALITFLISCNQRQGDNVVKENIDMQLKEISNAKAVVSVVKDGIVTLDGTCDGGNCSTIIANKIKQGQRIDSLQNNIVINTVSDLSFRTSVQSVIERYESVQADVVNGIVVLRGSVLKKELKQLIDDLSALKPKRIDNQLAIK